MNSPVRIYKTIAGRQRISARQLGRLFLATTCLAMVNSVPIGTAFAQEDVPRPQKGQNAVSSGQDQSGMKREYRFDIAAVPLMDGLEQISELTGYSFSVVTGSNLAGTGNAVQGTFDLQQALTKMFKDTGLTFALADRQIVVTTVNQVSGDRGTETLAPVIIQANEAPSVYLGVGSESGATVYSQQQIEGLVQGDSDPNKIFRANPNVQFQASYSNPNRQNRLKERGDSAAAEQDLRPAGVSISGGKIDQNNIMLDGVSVNTYAGTETNTSGSSIPDDDDNLLTADSVWGVHPQSVYIDANILEQAEIIDSNVSAKYGGFQGGVVNYKVKDPSLDPTFSASIKRGGSNWTDYHVKSAEAPDGDAVPPKYEKLFYNASASTPLSDDWGMLVSAGRRTAETTRTASEDYFGRQITNTTKADNFLGKLKYENDDGLALTMQVVYAPYAQEWESIRRIDSKMDILGNGLNSYVGIETPLDWQSGGFSDASFETKLSLNSSEVGREADANIARQVKSNVGGQFGGVCDATNCNLGALGDLYQSQQELSYQADFTASHFGNRLAFGADIRRIHAESERPETAYNARSSTANAAITCAVADDPFCENGVQANRFMTEYEAYSGEVSFYTGALYGQYALNFDHVPFGDLEVKPGLRLERDTFLGKTNLAPRFSTTYHTDWDIVFNAGWNRYYASNMLSYALRDLSPGATNYSRTINAGNGFVAGAFNATSSSTTNYGGSDLKTPFTDERTASVAFPLPAIGGQTRLKVVQRKGRDQFSRISTDSGSREYNLSNEGSSGYLSYSIEWAKDFKEDLLGGSHSFRINGQYGERTASNNSYFDSDEEDEDIIFDGQITDPSALSLITGNLDEPWIINSSLSSQFDDGRLRTALTGRYTFPYMIVADTGSNRTINGTTYDVYEQRQEKARFDLDLNLDYDLIRNPAGVLTLNASIENVLNRGGAHTLASDYPYRKGRTVWLGLTYVY